MRLDDANAMGLARDIFAAGKEEFMWSDSSSDEGVGGEEVVRVPFITSGADEEMFTDEAPEPTSLAADMLMDPELDVAFLGAEVLRVPYVMP